MGINNATKCGMRCIYFQLIVTKIEDYCLTVSDHVKRDTLLRTIKGKGAFRRFKDKIIDLDVEEQWYSFRNERYKEIAIEWCKDSSVNYTD